VVVLAADVVVLDVDALQVELALVHCSRPEHLVQVVVRDLQSELLPLLRVLCHQRVERILSDVGVARKLLVVPLNDRKYLALLYLLKVVLWVLDVGIRGRIDLVDGLVDNWNWDRFVQLLRDLRLFAVKVELLLELLAQPVDAVEIHATGFAVSE
jgi:hypothetical protein